MGENHSTTHCSGFLLKLCRVRCIAVNSLNLVYAAACDAIFLSMERRSHTATMIHATYFILSLSSNVACWPSDRDEDEGRVDA
jgi:hypothetical protein